MTDLVPLRSLPGIDGIEAALILNYADHEEDHALNARVSQLVATTFGIRSGELAPRYPWWVHSVPVADWTRHQEAQVRRLGFEWNRHFTGLSLTGAEEVEEWRRLGWDVLDAQGHVLRCVEHFGPAMTACAKGLCGRSMAELGALCWASSFAAPRRPSEDDKTRNARFLQLGERRRRRVG